MKKKNPAGTVGMGVAWFWSFWVFRLFYWRLVFEDEKRGLKKKKKKNTTTLFLRVIWCSYGS